MLSSHQQLLVERITALAGPLMDGAVLPAIVLERPKNPDHGDVALNLAMQIAKAQRKNPRDLAAALKAALEGDAALRELVESVEIAGPGFINIRLSARAKQQVVRDILDQATHFGEVTTHTGEPVMVEFVSANPTGPLHLGHGRQGALGDAMAALLKTQGYAVTREFYYNDAGVQIEVLAQSVQARARGLAPGDPGWPDPAYNGDYIAEIATDYRAGATVHADGRDVVALQDVDDLAAISIFAVAYLRHEQDLDLAAFGIQFDNYYLESSLYRDGRVAATVDALAASGKTYEKDGAMWLATTQYGDDKDRVMRKSDGTYTYFLPDVAYHVAKWERGFHKAINIQGGDHHGTVTRVRAGLQALNKGIPADYPGYVLHKMVRVVRSGEEVKISKRVGGYVTLRDLIDWVGRDAVRFFLISRKADTEFTFDVDLARAKSEENPVYYVQYAHARVCSVLAQWQQRDGGQISDLDGADLAPLVSPRENALLQLLAEYPQMLAQAAEEMAPHQLTLYLKECAAALHSYYNAERVLVDDAATKHARLLLLLATRQVLQNGLALMGVSAPEQM